MAMPIKNSETFCGPDDGIRNEYTRYCTAMSLVLVLYEFSGFANYKQRITICWWILLANLPTWLDYVYGMVKLLPLFVTTKENYYYGMGTKWSELTRFSHTHWGNMFQGMSNQLEVNVERISCHLTETECVNSSWESV